MMVATIFAKAIRDRWIAMTIAAGTLALWFFLAMAIYQDVDVSFYTDLPEGMRELMGIPEGADTASLSYNIMLSFAAALTLAGMAVSMGSAAIAGEERDGTLGLLLSNPKSRSYVLISKIISMVLLTVAATAVLWVAGLVVPAILDVDIGATQVGAMMLHLGLNAVFYGFMAIAIGAWTGSRSTASGVTAGVMILSYFAVGLLPLVSGLAGAAKVFPWYYFDGSAPLVNGIDWGHIAVLTVGIALLGTAALMGLNRRDLKGQSLGVTLLDRLRANHMTQRVFDRLAGSTRVSRLWVKATSEHQGLLVITAATMFIVMGVLMGPMYTAIEDSITDVAADFPEEILAIIGGADLGTPEGWFQSETFSFMAPVSIMIVTIVIGSRGLAGEEADRTMGLLLANPIRRSSIVLEQALAMVIYAIVVGGAIFSGVVIASAISGLGMSTGGIAAASLLSTLLGLMFGTLALAVSAGTGKVKAAVYTPIGVALTSYLLEAFLPLSDNYRGYARWTPNHYYLSSDPLNNGMNWGHGALLAGLAGALVATSVVLFERRDLRQG